MPAHIVVLRDGVSESQFDEVKCLELTALKNACMQFDAKLENKYRPSLTVLIVQKRHSTRFYANDNHPGVKYAFLLTQKMDYY